MLYKEHFTLPFTISFVPTAFTSSTVQLQPERKIPAAASAAGGRLISSVRAKVFSPTAQIKLACLPHILLLMCSSFSTPLFMLNFELSYTVISASTSVRISTFLGFNALASSLTISALTDAKLCSPMFSCSPFKLKGKFTLREYIFPSSPL